MNEKNYSDGIMFAIEKLKPTTADILLACGELTTGELRLAHAVLDWKRREIERELKDTKPQ